MSDLASRSSRLSKRAAPAIFDRSEPRTQAHLRFPGFVLLLAVTATLTVCPGARAQSAGAQESSLGSVLARFGSQYASSVVRVVAYRPIGPAPASVDRYADCSRLTPSRHTLWSTGVVLNDRGYILTCADGAQPGDSLQVHLIDGSRRGARFLAQDARTGVSLLQVEDTEALSSATHRPCAGPVRENDWVVVMSMADPQRPLDVRVGRLGQILGTGASSAATLQLDVGEGAGTCGGIVLDGNGHFIGMVINEQVVPAESGYGSSPGCSREVAEMLDRGDLRAITRGMLVTLAGRLNTSWTDRVGFLGVQAEADTGGLATLDIENPEFFESMRPIRIESVLPGSPAELAGLQVGDEIVEFNGRPSMRLEEVSAWIADTDPGNQIELRILRQGAPMIVTCRIGDRSSLDWMERQARQQYELRREMTQGLRMLQNELESMPASDRSR